MPHRTTALNGSESPHPVLSTGTSAVPLSLSIPIISYSCTAAKASTHLLFHLRLAARLTPRALPSLLGLFQPVVQGTFSSRMVLWYINRPMAALLLMGSALDLVTLKRMHGGSSWGASSVFVSQLPVSE